MMTATSPSKFSTCIAATALIFGLGGIGGAAADDLQKLPGGSKTHRTSERQSRLIPKPRLSSPTVSSLRATPSVCER